MQVGSSRDRQILGRAGQATVEYILVVFVSVVLVVTATRIFFPGVRSFIDDFMGGYVSCLLETGELPKFGDDSGIDSGECNPAGFAAGNSASADVPSPTGSKNPNNNGNSAENSSSDQNPTATKSSSSARSTRGGAGSNGGSRSTFTVGQSSAGRGTAGNDGGAGAGGDKKIDVSEDGSGGGGGYFGSAGNRGRSRKKFTGNFLGGELPAEAKARARADEKESRTAVPIAEAGGSSASKKVPLVAPEKTTKAVADITMEGLDIAMIIKIVMIAAIIIILLLLIGGQALQLSKSWEKGE